MKHVFFISLLCSSATQFAMLTRLPKLLVPTLQSARAYTVCSDECTRDMPTEFGKGWSGCKKRNRNILHIHMAMDLMESERGYPAYENPKIVNRISNHLHDPNQVCRDAVPELLELACRKCLPNMIAVILSAAKKHNIDIADSMALHYTNTESVAEMLIEHGMQVNRIPTHAYTTPLHRCQDYFIPFLLGKGADAQQEMKPGSDTGKLNRWHAINDELARCETLDLEKMAATLKPAVSKEELCAAMDKHCTVSWDSEKKESWKDFDLRLTPLALAIKNADVERTKTFLQHASPEVIMPQLQKLHFLTHIMEAWEPSKKWTYIWLRFMLNDYESRARYAHKTRVTDNS